MLIATSFSKSIGVIDVLLAHLRAANYWQRSRHALNVGQAVIGWSGVFPLKGLNEKASGSLSVLKCRHLDESGSQGRKLVLNNDDIERRHSEAGCRQTKQVEGLGGKVRQQSIYQLSAAASDEPVLLGAQ